VTLKGIYKIEGDALTIAYGFERPRDFETAAVDLRHVFHRESRTPTKLSPRLPNAEGCYWAIEPMDGGGLPTSMATGNINLIIKKAPDGSTLVTVAYISKLVDRGPEVEYRPVAFDRDKTRYILKFIQGGWSGSPSFRGVLLVHQEYRLDPAVLPPDRLKNLGIEVVPAEARRAAELKAAERAMQQARDARIEILPRPEVGKPFVFSITDTKGRVIRSADLKGKVVLIDCWAGWCSPCMTKMPMLKALHERRHADGFEVIGVNFDHNRERVEGLVKTLGLPWAEVYVPDDARTRGLWADGPGINDLPRLLLIDRQGILCWEGRPGELEERVTDLLK
jgi:thiol-disulfide isomerase/thioredoxin